MWKKKIILFLTSQSITLFGSQIVQMAIVWYVTLSTSSGAWVAAFSVCSYLPQFLVSFAGGVWADRYSRKMLIISADAGIAIITLGMFFLMPCVPQDESLLKMLLLMSVLRSIGAGIQSPAVSAVIPQLVPKEFLMKYNGINAAMQSAVQFAAPALAGVILSMGTLRSTLIIDIITALIGISLFLCVRLPVQKRGKFSVSALSDIRVGIRYALTEKRIGGILMVYGLFTFLCVPAGYLSGLLVSRVYGDTYWYLTAVELCGFGGMMAGGLMMSMSSVWSIQQKRRTTLSVGLGVFGAMAIGMSIAGNFMLYLIFMVIYGVALATVQTTITTFLQENTKNSLQGRIFGFMGSMYAICYPVGMAIFGMMADYMPLQWIMEGSGVLLILLAVIIIWSGQSGQPQVGTS